MKGQNFAAKTMLDLFIMNFFVGGAVNNRNKKLNMLSVALFATLSQKQNVPHKFYFSVSF